MFSVSSLEVFAVEKSAVTLPQLSRAAIGRSKKEPVYRMLRRGFSGERLRL
jgi:hypothetical protein